MTTPSNLQSSLEPHTAVAIQLVVVERNPPSAAGGSGTAVFVIDDDLTFGSLVRELLEDAGFAVQSFTAGAEALAAARVEAPAVVILDVNLPGASGYEICRHLKDDLGDTVGVIFVSGDRRESFDRVAGLLLGADDYVVKPVDPDELLARVRALFRRVVRPEVDQPAVSNGDGELTPREHEVLTLLASGKRQGDIAKELVISPKTVDVHSRAEAVAMAHRRNLVSVAYDGAPSVPAEISA